MHVVIAIDGPAGAGKSTIARSLAAKLGYTYIDSGAMYRAVALWALRLGVDPSDALKLEDLAGNAVIELTSDRRVVLNGEDVTTLIRTPEVSAGASQVAAVKGVRAALVLKQRGIAATASVVMEGRDIGTVVFPDAQVKVFLDADPSERVRRRSAEMPHVSEQQLSAQMSERDARDRERVESPLVQAPDAYYLDSSGRSPEQVEEEILKLVRAKVSHGKEIH